jgi:prepilin-type N-terminal cleavage/methylation domain-containing protein
MRQRDRGESGFTLVEVLVAAGLLVVGISGAAQLLVLSSQATRDAGRTTVATLLAQQQMEVLRGAPWGSAALDFSPPDTLTVDRIGYVDYLDDSGGVVGDGTSPPPAAARFVRRWSVRPLASDPADAVLVEVLVLPRPGAGAHLLSVRTRWE